MAIRDPAERGQPNAICGSGLDCGEVLADVVMQGISELYVCAQELFAGLVIGAVKLRVWCRRLVSEIANAVLQGIIVESRSRRTVKGRHKNLTIRGWGSTGALIESSRNGVVSI